MTGAKTAFRCAPALRGLDPPRRTPGDLAITGATGPATLVLGDQRLRADAAAGKTSENSLRGMSTPDSGMANDQNPSHSLRLLSVMIRGPAFSERAEEA